MLLPTDMDRLISEWLARAHPVPEQVLAEWSSQGVALLPLGELFAAVRLSGALVHAATGSEQPDQVAAALKEQLRGPVIHDPRGTNQTYYPLIQWHAGLVWDYNRSAPCLRDDTYLGVPRLDLREPPGAYWAVPPCYDGNLCRPQAVRDLIDAGHRQLIQQLSV
ncbi:hypothetical protein SLINC_3280 [Streptomyces lincolnensis]|uniref:Uncharacterized protein n=1 Tax=Streptomyces lincolnensis TaxID=1915 RepID=A0A1B1MAG8_STRLN|nr:hypothetical protein [Streptomyces lincolnensis]ANS65504.1 hypothetical protein SLINC_3280 [Streptomyces lincolnensis]AXG54732.1 hypothetical protein SLCG_3577 [Streptomyces lincolnensis]